MARLHLRPLRPHLPRALHDNHATKAGRPCRALAPQALQYPHHAPLAHFHNQPILPCIHYKLPLYQYHVQLGETRCVLPLGFVPLRLAVHPVTTGRPTQWCKQGTATLLSPCLAPFACPLAASPLAMIQLGLEGTLPLHPWTQEVRTLVPMLSVPPCPVHLPPLVS